MDEYELSMSFHFGISHEYSYSRVLLVDITSLYAHIPVGSFGQFVAKNVAPMDTLERHGGGGWCVKMNKVMRGWERMRGA